MGWPLSKADCGGWSWHSPHHLTPHMEACNLMYYHVLHLTPPIFHLPFPLEHICFYKHDITWHELYGNHNSVIVPLLPVGLAIGLVLCFSISFFEALSHLFNICGDSVRACMGTRSQKIEIHRKVGAPSKHQIVWWITRHCWPCTIICLE